MMRYFLLFIIALLCSQSFGQDEFCHPKEINRISKKLIRKLSKDEYRAVMNISKDDAVDDHLFMIHKRKEGELDPIYKYLAHKGCNYLVVDNLEEIVLEYTYYKMHKKDTCMSDLLQPYLDNYFERKERYRRNINADSIDGVYIPRNLEESIQQINSFWTDSLKTEVKNMTEKEFSIRSHFGFGLWIRNNWGLWGGSRLKTYFNDLGVYHPDDMSGIILNSYHRHITGQEVKLDEQIDYYQYYWKVNEEPSQNSYPKKVKDIEFNSRLSYNLKANNYPGCIHVQTNSRKEKFWIYDYHFGWLEISKEELEELQDQSTREETLRRLFQENQR